MSISFQCPRCGKKLKAPDSAAGKASSCPGCGGTVTCPAPGDDEEVVEMQLSPQKPKGFDPFADLDGEKSHGTAMPAASSEPGDDNPYAAPKRIKPTSGKGKKKAELKSIAQYQKGVIACIGGWVLCILASFVSGAVLHEKIQPGANAIDLMKVSPIFSFLMIVSFVLVAASAVFGFMLSMKVSNVAVGILVALCNVLCGCIGLIPLAIMNGRATNRLREAGIDVGFFGADMSAFR